MAFEADVVGTDWTNVFQENDVKKAALLFQLTFMQIVDKHMPVITIKTRIHQLPWVSNEFLSLIDL